MNFKLIILMIALGRYCDGNKTSYYILKSKEVKYNGLDGHSLVTDSEVFPYIAAILRNFSYLSAGALIANDWVLTGAGALHTVTRWTRNMRIRLGSINYKKGGVLLPIKYIKIHPYFDSSRPAFDLALIKLSEILKPAVSPRPIRLQKNLRAGYATHFIVTSWQPEIQPDKPIEPMMGLIKKQRILQVMHFHPTEDDKCSQDLEAIGVEQPRDMMCLENEGDPCVREVGAPVVLNGILWGIISSWRPPNCVYDAGSRYVTLVSSLNVTLWIHSLVNNRVWIPEGANGS